MQMDGAVEIRDGAPIAIGRRMDSLYSGDIIAAFLRNVPGSYVRDYRASGGYITVCKDYRTILWGDQTTTRKTERAIPATTLISIPKGNVTRASMFHGVKLHRPGWLREFRRAARHLSYDQMRRITKALRRSELFPGIIV